MRQCIDCETKFELEDAYKFVYYTERNQKLTSHFCPKCKGVKHFDISESQQDKITEIVSEYKEILGKTNELIEKEQMKDQVKSLRVEIDGLAQLCNITKPDSPGSEYGNLTPRSSKQVEKATDNLYFAKAWLGKVLGELGQDNPYKSGYRTKEDIEPTADTAKWIDVAEINLEKDLTFLGKRTYVGQIDFLRQKIKPIIQKVKELKVLDYSIELRYLDNCLTQLETSRFWLGFELQRIKEEK